MRQGLFVVCFVASALASELRLPTIPMSFDIKEYKQGTHDNLGEVLMLEMEAKTGLEVLDWLTVEQRRLRDALRDSFLLLWDVSAAIQKKRSDPFGKMPMKLELGEGIDTLLESTVAGPNTTASNLLENVLLSTEATMATTKSAPTKTAPALATTTTAEATIKSDSDRNAELEMAIAKATAKHTNPAALAAAAAGLGNGALEKFIASSTAKKLKSNNSNFNSNDNSKLPVSSLLDSNLKNSNSNIDRERRKLNAQIEEEELGGSGSEIASPQDFEILSYLVRMEKGQSEKSSFDNSVDSFATAEVHSGLSNLEDILSLLEMGSSMSSQGEGGYSTETAVWFLREIKELYKLNVRSVRATTQSQ